jgi:uncharacterized protein DUF2878
VINTLFHIIFFEVCWALSIVYHDSVLSWLVIALVAVYLLVERKFEKPRPNEMILRLSLIAVGLLMELSFRYLGLSNYPSPDYLVPSWLFLVWLSFGLTFSGCYRWLSRYSIWFSVLLGAVFGPITYWVASRIAPFEILEPIGFTIISSVFWGVLYGVSIKLSKPASQESLQLIENTLKSK